MAAETVPRPADDARLVVVEINPDAGRPAGHRLPGPAIQVIHGSAADLAQWVPGPVDAVVSGPPVFAYLATIPLVTDAEYLRLANSG